ncbi:glycosyltransferase family 1 protein [Hyaloscypha variabilis F]|jgi:UDP:flavonoid glycosyltransferase YjiC (YdhE family)|uniref:Glycosyltransferase family 1 protein n=1 Tax=Hyaloscypha variabilis (strain UAMH 11265 / GT02V1 / F) TaxID=1149755 RepID=A0A2J6S6A4_HYAVF|nr:glycosyltransferase family 1 protein [Hyaloscypha variabilis F]
MGSTASNKPLILICCTPIYGHLMPIRAIGKELIARGYEVTFVTGSSYRSIIESIGASFVPLSGYGDFTEEDFPKRWPIRETLPEGPVQLTFDMEEIFLKSLTSQHEAEQTALKILSDKYSGRPIIVVTESAYLGSLPTAAGAPGIQPAATLGIGIVPVVISSIDHPPFGPGLPPDSTPEGRERNKAMNESIQKQFLAQPNSTFRKLLAELGATDPDIPFFFDAMYMLPNRFLQMCIPSIEYPRSDLPESIRFAGGLPKGHRDTYANPPSWWDEIVTNKTKKIVLVSQGTLTLNFTDLVLPTLTGLKDREDILVVVALGKEGRALPGGTTVPANARIADFIPFDDVLPYCAVFVSNGGYGALQHAIGHSVPLVIGGTTEDKPEIAARAEWAGIAVNMRTATPSPEVVLAAVDEIFSNPKYKERAKVLEAEMATFDPMEIVVKNIEELAAGKP